MIQARNQKLHLKNTKTCGFILGHKVVVLSYSYPQPGFDGVFFLASYRFTFRDTAGPPGCRPCPGSLVVGKQEEGLAVLRILQP